MGKGFVDYGKVSDGFGKLWTDSENYDFGKFPETVERFRSLWKGSGASGKVLKTVKRY